MMRIGCGGITFCLLTNFLRSFAGTWRGQMHARPAGFGQSDGNGLFGGAGAVLAFANVMEFFANEFARLSGS